MHDDNYNASAMEPANSSITDLTYAFESAVMPTGEDVSLTSMLGVLLYAGHCNAYPTATYAEVMAMRNQFANVGTMQRANIWGYLAGADLPTLILIRQSHVITPFVME